MNGETETVKNMISSMKSQLQSAGEPRTLLVGCGGAGTNFIRQFKGNGDANFTTVAINTDEDDLKKANADKNIIIGKSVTKGKGAGGFAEVGEYSAELASGILAEVMGGADIVFLVAGMGGGTGTGALPVIARIAKSLNSLVVSVVTTPFSVEGERVANAQDGLAKLREHSDSTIVLGNDKLLALAPDLPVNGAFTVMNKVISQVVTSTRSTLVDSIKVSLAMESAAFSVTVAAEEPPEVEYASVESVSALPLYADGGQEVTEMPTPTFEEPEFAPPQMDIQ